MNINEINSEVSPQLERLAQVQQSLNARSTGTDERSKEALAEVADLGVEVITDTNFLSAAGDFAGAALSSAAEAAGTVLEVGAEVAGAVLGGIGDILS